MSGCSVHGEREERALLSELEGPLGSLVLSEESGDEAPDVEKVSASSFAPLPPLPPLFSCVSVVTSLLRR